MSQKTLKGFPLFSGSIQYSPLFTEIPLTTMSLQERPGLNELNPRLSSLGERKKYSDHYVITGSKYFRRIPE